MSNFWKLQSMTGCYETVNWTSPSGFRHIFSTIIVQQRRASFILVLGSNLKFFRRILDAIAEAGCATLVINTVLFQSFCIGMQAVMTEPNYTCRKARYALTRLEKRSIFLGPLASGLFWRVT